MRNIIPTIFSQQILNNRLLQDVSSQKKKKLLLVVNGRQKSNFNDEFKLD